MLMGAGWVRGKVPPAARRAPLKGGCNAAAPSALRSGLAFAFVGGPSRDYAPARTRALWGGKTLVVGGWVFAEAFNLHGFLRALSVC